MKRMLPVTELARDERFSHMAIEDAVFDPRNLSPSAQRNTLAPTYENATDNARGLMHGIFVGEIQALEGAGRTCFDFDLGEARDQAPFGLKLDMARQCWDEARHVEISIKLGEHMGSRDRRVRRADVALRSSVQPGSRAAPHRCQSSARGSGYRRLQDDARLRNRAVRSGARVRRGLDVGRRGDSREDGQ